MPLRDPGSSQRRVATIVLNWKDTLCCLESLRDDVRAQLSRVILVDNASTDGSVSQILVWLQNAGVPFIHWSEDTIAQSTQACDSDPAYILVETARNRGYAGGNNVGIQCAFLFSGTEYLFILNNDAVLEFNALLNLVTFADETPVLGIIGSTIIEDAGRIRIAGGARYNSVLTTSTNVDASDQPTNKITTLTYVCGAAMFVRSEVFHAIGLFCEDYFLYFEELDFTKRAARAGFQSGWCRDSIVYHARGRSAGSRASAKSVKSYLSEYHSNLSCLIFTRKHYRRTFWIASTTRLVAKLVHLGIHSELHLLHAVFRAYYTYFTTVYRRSI